MSIGQSEQLANATPPDTHAPAYEGRERLIEALQHYMILKYRADTIAGNREQVTEAKTELDRIR